MNPHLILLIIAVPVDGQEILTVFRFQMNPHLILLMIDLPVARNSGSFQISNESSPDPAYNRWARNSDSFPISNESSPDPAHNSCSTC